MNITELRYIIEIAQCGSVSAASKRLYVAQPNISKAIRSLEEEYQIQLFVRTARGMVPTREGQQFIAQARRVIQEIEGLNRKFPGNKKGTDVEMKISIPRASYASYAFGKYVEQVRGCRRAEDAYPGVAILSKRWTILQRSITILR